jgi:hypothetical protein
MKCFHPLSAFQSAAGGKPYFSETRNHPTDKSIQFPCGQCVGCRLKRSRDWAIRCMHEASLYENNCFITLTYNNENYPQYGSLVKSHLQDFIRSLRKYVKTHRWNGQVYELNPPISIWNKRKKKYEKRAVQCYETIRFYACGEYGDELQRPHYHAILFNCDFLDKVIYSQRNGVDLYYSPTLEHIWGKGFATVGNVTFDSAAYVARYVLKKQKVSEKSPENVKTHYMVTDPMTGEIHNLEPEYTNMSRKPGIAHDWFEKWSGDVFPSDEVIHQGRTLRTPRYYDDLYKQAHEPELKEVKEKRLARAREMRYDNTKERLAAKEKVALARLNLNSRSYENK